jgi:hypothetical protein
LTVMVEKFFQMQQNLHIMILILASFSNDILRYYYIKCYRIICRTVSGASNPFLPILMCREMVLYIPYKKDKNRRVCTGFVNLDLSLYKGGILSWSEKNGPFWHVHEHQNHALPFSSLFCTEIFNL